MLNKFFLRKSSSILSIFVFISAMNIHAATLNFQAEGFSGSVFYNEKAKPGEAVFARIKMKIARSYKKKNGPEVQATMQLYKNNKKIDSSQFYFLNVKNKKQLNPELLTGIPLSTWLSADDSYFLKIIFEAGSGVPNEIQLPFQLEDVTFEKEVLNLDEKNSMIKQDIGPERLAQIEKLNTILETIMPQDIYSLKPFIKPINTERKTANFGDRRVYTFTNGKSTTNLHYGNDYGVPEGTDVLACAEGRVVMAEFRISTGWSVVIEHLPGLYSLYYHMSSINVNENDFVKPEQKIGLSGSTGLATGPHLHWEVRLNLAAVKPEFFMQDFTFNGIQD